MISSKPFQQGHHIVLLGDFNPKIFQPAWFAAQELIGKAEAENADIEIVHPEVVIFRLNWLRLEVTRERFSAGTIQDSFEEVTRDLVLGTFRILSHTPIKKIGINTEAHFEVGSIEKYHSIGHTLAPKEVWNDLLLKPGLRSLTMEGVRPDGIKGQIQVTVEPSLRVQPGLYIRINDHFEVDNPDSVLGSDEIVAIIEKNWPLTVERANCIITTLFGRL
jgi:hypothetical protein